MRAFLGLADGDILQAIKSFPGLPHRQYPVRRIGHIVFINDSKATNAAATEKALASYDDIFWIVGGRAKSGGLNGLESYMDRIRHAYLIGEATDEFALWFEKNAVPYAQCGTLGVAVDKAHSDAQRHGKGTVLLSPACASFDQFASFEERGNAFAEAVCRLKEAAA